MTHPQPAPAPSLTASAHGELGCAEVEGLLTESALENDALRDMVRMYEQADRDRQAEMDVLRLQNARLHALVGDTRKKMRNAIDAREGTDSQIEILLAELDAAEAAAVPVGTLVTATVSQDEMTATYRRASRVTRGPLPPAVIEAVKGAEGEIAEAMHAAGVEALTRVVRNAVRRRRAAARRATARR